MAFLRPLAARRGPVTAGPATVVSASGAAPASATAARQAAAPAASGWSSSLAFPRQERPAWSCAGGSRKGTRPEPSRFLPQALLAPEARWRWPHPEAGLSTVGAGDNRGGGIYPF